MNRRNFIKRSSVAGSGAAALLGLHAGEMKASAQSFRFAECGSAMSGPQVPDRLDQGPFRVEEDSGWYTIKVTSQSQRPIKNYGLGLVGYTWEENGPSLAVRAGKQTLEQHVESLAALPFVSVLYIRCDWRDVQTRPGRLDLHPVWKFTFDAAKRYGLRVAFRVQLSSPELQPQHLSLPDFLHERIPLVKIGRRPATNKYDFIEPRYDHPNFQSAFRELNQLLIAEFDGNPLVEFTDLMMYGFWGEGHTSDLPGPFPDFLTARKTFLEMTRYQIENWKRVPLAVNTQPDISSVGNDDVLDLSLRSNCWLRSDSIILEEPIQIDELANRAPWLPVVMEDGYHRHYKLEENQPEEGSSVGVIENGMLHALDLGANYWSLWTEAENLQRYHERYPRGFTELQRRLGYRLRPAWIWQRKRYGTSELIVCVANDGVAGVPGALRLTVESPDGGFKLSGCLDAGHPFAGKLRQASFILPQGMEGKRLKLRAEIETKGGVRRPVTWACEQNLESDNSLAFQIKSHSDPNWRKGI